MKHKYSASIIANWFLQKDETMKSDVMKVLKLVYISHGFHMALTDSPLIKEGVQAWQYGPVIPELYFQLKAESLLIDSADKPLFEDDKNLHKFLEVIYKKYGKFDGFKLSNLTHQKGTPWDITVNKFEALIKEDVIKDHYKSLLN
jgi:uncharacterized phage-associated protein